MSKPVERHQGWRWVHHLFPAPLTSGTGDVQRRTRRYLAVLVLLGISLNVSLTLFAAV